ncbi:MAG: hypothetical protein A2233_02535 [Candidatus Kerfeldbacteria bacterium RIFOXYA2_FULL_38_24]|nr:MAG: hypothetical protein A2233_02535 [Candidatus Kerfeldbacteria bacterium RIFOXYA2_FULL_38_24]OGY89405.1 MAG: hypothetical protein A2458_01375 [Candidatus Kerfeldbacteria bacterium RIFOXYC2_FULL_38_9]
MSLQFKKFEIPSVTLSNKYVMSPLELKDYIPFVVKRVYFISEITGNTGAHCHFKEEEFFVLQKGTATAVIDRGKGLEEIFMQGPGSAVYVGNYVWHQFKDFSRDAILLALSSTNYQADRSDYCEDYKKYLKIREK